MLVDIDSIVWPDGPYVCAYLIYASLILFYQLLNSVFSLNLNSFHKTEYNVGKQPATTQILRAKRENLTGSLVCQHSLGL